MHIIFAVSKFGRISDLYRLEPNQQGHVVPVSEAGFNVAVREMMSTIFGTVMHHI